MRFVWSSLVISDVVRPRCENEDGKMERVKKDMTGWTDLLRCVITQMTLR